MAIKNKSNRWLKSACTTIVFASLLSCTHASHKTASIGMSKLITESCPKKLDKEVNNHSLGINGTVVVNIQVDKLGKASSVTIVQSSDNPQIDTAVINFYEQCTYTVAKIKGRIVQGATMQGYTYYL